MILKIENMTTKLVIKLVLTVLVYLSWHTLGYGLTAENQRAIDSSELLDIVTRAAVIDNNLFETSRSCLPIKLTDPVPEKMGIEGMVFEKIPGQYEIALLLKTEYEKQPKRDRQLKQLDYLTEQGIFNASTGAIETTDGEREVRRYRLTWQGALNMGKRGGSTSICLTYGRKAFGEIKSIVKQQQQYKAGDVYNVTYSLKLLNISVWAKNDQALKLFDGLLDALKENERVTKVVKTKVGWRLLKERRPARALSGFDTVTLPIDIKMIDKKIEVPSVDAVNAYINENIRSMDWYNRNEKICMPFSLQASDFKSRQIDGEFSVTYYDIEKRRKHEFQKLVSSLHILAALEHAGLAEMEYISQEGVVSDISGNSVKPTHEAGVRFRVNRQAVESIGLTKRGNGCIPYGREVLEILALKAQVEIDRKSYHFTAKKTVVEVPGWAKKIAERLAALKSIIDHGLMEKGYLIGKSYNSEKYWDLLYARSSYPKIRYNALPSYLEPLFQNTVQAMPAKKISAPIVHGNDNGSEYTPPRYKGERRPVNSPGFETMDGQRQDKHIQLDTSENKSNMAPKTLYPVDNGAVHVISIRRSSGRQGSPIKDVEDIVGQVSVNVRVSNSVLLLYSHNPTVWNMSVDDGYTIKKIIITGSKNQQVNIAGVVKPETIVISERDLMNSIDIPRYVNFPTSDSKNNLLDIAMITKAVTGKAPTTYQSHDRAPGGGFYITESTPGFRKPLAIRPSDYPENTKITIQSEWPDYWSDREFSSGKLYTEATVRLSDALSAHKSSNLGLCLSRTNGVVGSGNSVTNLMIQGEQSVRKDGDIFGIAVDFDNQRIYYHVNGNWMTGSPGSGDGIKLEKDKFYRICAYGMIKSGKGRQSRTEWEIGNATRKYSKNIPSEYIEM